MKTKTFALFLFLTMIGCSVIDLKDDSSRISQLDETNDHAITLQQAKNLLYSFYESNFEAKGSTSSLPIITQEFKSSLYSVETRATRQSSFPIYVFNYADNKGFALISGDNRVGPYICIADSGRFDSIDELQIPGLKMYLTNVNTYANEIIDGIREKRKPSITKSSYYVDDNGNLYMGDKLPCIWAQDTIYNEYCPKINNRRTLVGCGPVALGQLMYYHGKNHGIYNWNVMRDVTDARSYFPVEGDSALFLVQSLLAELGDTTNLNVHYGINASGMSMDGVTRTLNNFGYTSSGFWSPYYNINTLLLDLINYGPLFCVGYSQVILNNGVGRPINGHAWLFDQYMLHPTLVDNDTTYIDLVHINWGFGGACNGYYLPYEPDYNNCIVSESGEVVTRADTAGTPGRYIFELEMLVGVQP